ncbi:hypothetical protein [Mycobacterium sp. GA-1199]|uniref:hypothetical protein n=1 Tax=Mycobacterium sp. GA-1199 TaxID=1772287 RepID=UPI0012E3D453|nr:hypothetical protein [Mycobacterium sp. GA-1199]
MAADGRHSRDCLAHHAGDQTAIKASLVGAAAKKGLAATQATVAILPVVAAIPGEG